MRDRVKIVRLERASKDAGGYMQRVARASVSFIERSRSSRVPHGNLSLRQVGETGTSLSPTLPTCMDDAWTSESWKRPEIRMRVQTEAQIEILSYVPCRISGCGARARMSFCSKILPINFDHYFLIFPDTSKRGRWDNPRNPRDDVTCKYLLVKRF